MSTPDWNDIALANGPDAMRRILDNQLTNPPADPGGAPPTTNPEILFRCAADIPPQQISWLWKGRIARGKLTIVAGDPGLGKSQLTLDMAARTSTGRLWPDKEYCPSGNVVILSAEDDAADTLVPRLEAAGADLDCVFVLEAVRTADGKGRRCFCVSEDLAKLELMLASIGDVSLIVIDPISAYLGKADSHKNSEVRALLAPLSDMASKHKAAIVCVSHMNKGGGSQSLMRVTGSLAFVAAARAAFTILRDPADMERRLFLPSKNNIGKDQEGLRFEVVGCVTEKSQVGTSRINWLDGAVSMTADEALAALHENDSQSADTAIDDAEGFLRNLLIDGPVRARELKSDASDAGISWASVRRAASKLGVQKDKYGAGKDGFWEWSLPSI